ncbi:hypothetical protein J8273_4105 [Carpediemonas membranifera]|uniref:Uncharacterized protein n=1 Tax=Carpediemonas membranifera TaxID=201153 RepID=A0A8J6AYB1_9EUKA|nr:hypothetical protein J8273_4105 [Carpediemonas membranifera]|eukprot:KAG9394440.1 hypothetical protein J8273_4105 [Carpediemonas membranifera]
MRLGVHFAAITDDTSVAREILKNERKNQYVTTIFHEIFERHRHEVLACLTGDKVDIDLYAQTFKTLRDLRNTALHSKQNDVSVLREALVKMVTTGLLTFHFRAAKKLETAFMRSLPHTPSKPSAMKTAVTGGSANAPQPSWDIMTSKERVAHWTAIAQSYGTKADQYIYDIAAMMDEMVTDLFDEATRAGIEARDGATAKLFHHMFNEHRKTACTLLDMNRSTTAGMWDDLGRQFREVKLIAKVAGNPVQSTQMWGTFGWKEIRTRLEEAGVTRLFENLREVLDDLRSRQAKGITAVAPTRATGLTPATPKKAKTAPSDAPNEAGRKWIRTALDFGGRVDERVYEIAQAVSGSNPPLLDSATAAGAAARTESCAKLFHELFNVQRKRLVKLLRQRQWAGGDDWDALGQCFRDVRNIARLAADPSLAAQVWGQAWWLDISSRLAKARAEDLLRALDGILAALTGETKAINNDKSKQESKPVPAKDPGPDRVLAMDQRVDALVYSIAAKFVRLHPGTIDPAAEAGIAGRTARTTQLFHEVFNVCRPAVLELRLPVDFDKLGAKFREFKKLAKTVSGGAKMPADKADNAMRTVAADALIGGLRQVDDALSHAKPRLSHDTPAQTVVKARNYDHRAFYDEWDDYNDEEEDEDEEQFPLDDNTTMRRMTGLSVLLAVDCDRIITSLATLLGEINSKFVFEPDTHPCAMAEAMFMAPGVNGLRAAIPSLARELEKEENFWMDLAARFATLYTASIIGDDILSRMEYYADEQTALEKMFDMRPELLPETLRAIRNGVDWAIHSHLTPEDHAGLYTKEVERCLLAMACMVDDFVPDLFDKATKRAIRSRTESPSKICELLFVRHRNRLAQLEGIPQEKMMVDCKMIRERYMGLRTVAQAASIGHYSKKKGKKQFKDIITQIDPNLLIDTLHEHMTTLADEGLEPDDDDPHMAQLGACEGVLAEAQTLVEQREYIAAGVTYGVALEKMVFALGDRYLSLRASSCDAGFREDVRGRETSDTAVFHTIFVQHRAELIDVLTAAQSSLATLDFVDLVFRFEELKKLSNAAMMPSPDLTELGFMLTMNGLRVKEFFDHLKALELTLFGISHLER